ncbi:leucine-rich repeat protein [Rhizoctonia solani]|uniref:Leucine-rich repeat protein n=1 Tax=Rhizoctonia solani TaxID=456999 RepID=A0A8H8NXH6_9AGAM|nr:leucine-rich repeat protein [Rhizoctonia solani]QRW21200.1 leucine-rich repeat protein [Rhizoctonia solani]
MSIVVETEAGDDYVRRWATFIRTHEQRLAGAGYGRRPNGSQQPSALPNLLSWVGLASAPDPGMVLTTDLHHIFYLLMRFEALELPVGPLEVKLLNPTRPISFASQLATGDRADAVSIRSSSAMSTMSRLSLGGSWWSRSEPPPVDAELKYIYSSFTKLPALSIKQAGLKLIAELAQDPLTDQVIPFDVFKNLQSLELLDVDPRAVLGWDRLADNLRSLTIKRSGLEDVSDILIDAVVDDPLRREGKVAPRRRRIHRPSSSTSSRQSSWRASQLPPTVPEDPVPEPSEPDPENDGIPPPTISPHKWSRLRRLSFADNGLTFFPTAPLANLVNVTHLDLSSNLLVAVPSGLGALYNLVSLNLSDNMIESVLGIYATLGSITNLDLSKNRLESLCGLERLRALERVDLRLNHVEESAEVGRLVGLPNILNISIQGNPFTENEDEYRARCFEYFLKEGKSITLDGTPPSFYERRSITRRVPTSLRLWAEASATSKEQANTDLDHSEPLSSFSPPPMTAAAVSPKPVIHHHNKPRKRKPTRIVDLDDIGESSGTSVVHSRETSNEILSHSPQSISLLGTGTSPKLSSSPGSIHRSRERGQRPTPHAMPSTIREETEPPTPCIEVKPSRPSAHRRQTSASSVGGKPMGSKAAKRRARASASVYEPGPTVTDEQRFDDAEAFRRKMEALRAEVGDGWLKVLSQQQQGGIA